MKFMNVRCHITSQPKWKLILPLTDNTARKMRRLKRIFQLWIPQTFILLGQPWNSNLPMKMIEPPKGIEPSTCYLRNSCSTSWARVARFSFIFIGTVYETAALPTELRWQLSFQRGRRDAGLWPAELGWHLKCNPRWFAGHSRLSWHGK